MVKRISILGRQPALGIAELESLYGANNVRPVGMQAALVDCPVEFSHLGGSMKLGHLLNELPTTAWVEIIEHLIKIVPKYLPSLPEGKLQLGLSAYGFNASAKQLMDAGLKLKKVIRQTGRSVRLIPNHDSTLNSAQVLHNHLTGPLGWELILIKDGFKTLLAQSVAVQDINAYAARDQARPKRDARVGMLPPKLAQIIINLARGQQMKGVLLDPFCGTGVILQEAILMGYKAIGTDINARMVEYSETNLKWMGFRPGVWRLAAADAMTHTWDTSYDFDIIASETYLGRPFSVEPAPKVLAEVMQDADTIHRKFLQNVARQTQPGFRMALAVPAWRTKNGFKHLKMLDSMGQLGYNQVSFVHVRREDLIYYRENQTVARELIVLTRK